MTKRIASKYKKFKQTYIDLWVDGKHNVKIIKKIFLLQCFLYLIVLKREYLQNAKKYTNRIFAHWNIKKINLLLLPRVEQLLRKIPTKYLGLNSKSRIYKYIMRRNQYLFQSREQIIKDLVYILERKRKKPFWRRTKFEILFRLKQRLQHFYSNLSLRQFKNFVTSRNLIAPTKLITSDVFKKKKIMFIFTLALYRLLELRLDIVLYRGNFIHSMQTARQLISHGNVLVNGKCISNCNYTTQLFDCIELQNTKNLTAVLILPKVEALSLYLNEYGFFFYKNVLFFKFFFKLLIVIAKYLPFFFRMNTFVVLFNYPVISDLILYLILYARYVHFIRMLPQNMLVTKNNTCLVVYKYAMRIEYPFEFNSKHLQKLTNFLST